MMPARTIASEFDQCIKCGLCGATCPIGRELLLEKFTPRGKIQLTRYYHQGDLVASRAVQEIFATCLLCGACGATCPSGVNLNDVFVGMRETLARQKGVHPSMEGLMRSLETHHNISGEDNARRSEWKESLGSLPHLKDRAPLVYFVGCVASYFPMVKRVPQHLAQILDRAHMDFAVLGGEEWCCGFPLIGAGYPEGAPNLLKHNVEKVKALGAKQVVFSCPSCYRVWKDAGDMGLELFHSTQLMDRLIGEGALRFKGSGTTVTYHDPCDLGRNTGIYEAPRRILRSIPGLRFVEMENKLGQSVCCGGGGNLEMAAPGLSEVLAQRRIDEVRRTGAKVVVTACQQCIRTLRSRARRQKIDLQVWDISELVFKTMA